MTENWYFNTKNCDCEQLSPINLIFRDPDKSDVMQKPSKNIAMSHDYTFLKASLKFGFFCQLFIFYGFFIIIVFKASNSTNCTVRCHFDGNFT